jgi:hypothetical protein
MGHEPSRLVGDFQQAAELVSRHAFLAGAKQVRRQKPLVQGNVATDWNPAIIKAYYFSSVDMTISANVLLHQIVHVESGRLASDATAQKSVERGYKILKDTPFRGIKRQVVVRLDKPQTEVELRRIAEEIHSSNSHQFDRTFITYYLPGVNINQMAWATTHYDPDLEVEILGPKLGDLEKAAKEKTSDSGLVGQWIDVMGVIKITVRLGRPVLVESFKDGYGPPLTENLIEHSSRRGRRFDVVDSEDRDRYTILKDGRLEQSDKDGVFDIDPRTN